MPLNQGNLISSRGELEVSTGVMSRLQSGWAVDVLGRRGLNVVTEAPASATRIAGRAFDAAGRHYATTASGTVLRGGMRYSAGGAMLVTGAAPTADSRIVRDEFGAFLVSADGAVHVYGAERMTLPGTAGNYASAPDAAGIRPSGDFEARVLVALDDWTPAAATAFFAKNLATGNQRSFTFTISTSGFLTFFLSSDGTATTVSVNSGVAPTIADGSSLWVRVTYDSNNGAGGNDVRFFTSTDGVSWTQLGSTQTTAGTATAFGSTADLSVGAFNAAGITQPAAGKFYRAQLFDGIDGTLVADFNPNDYESGTTFVSRTTGETWTLNGTAAIAIGN